jgi:hypothetical protein
VARVLGFFVFLVPLIPFAAVGVLVTAVPATRRFGVRILLSFALLPLGVMSGWCVSRATIPESSAARSPTPQPARTAPAEGRARRVGRAGSVASRDRRDEYFGTLRYDSDLDRWDAVIPGTDVPLHFTSDDAELEDSLIRAGEHLSRAFPEWRARAEDCAASKLLSLKNEVWLSEGEEPLTAEKFRRRVRLEAVVLYSGGSVELYYDDDDIFRGHTILVTGSVELGPLDAHLAG